MSLELSCKSRAGYSDHRSRTLERRPSSPEAASLPRDSTSAGHRRVKGGAAAVTARCLLPLLRGGQRGVTVESPPGGRQVSAELRAAPLPSTPRAATPRSHVRARSDSARRGQRSGTGASRPPTGHHNVASERSAALFKAYANLVAALH